MRSWVAIAAVGLVTGCVIRGDGDEDPEATTGTVDISWQVGPQGCEASGVSEIEVSMDGVGGTFDCEDGGASVVVPAGTHDLELFGLDAEGVARFGGLAEGIVVRGGDITTVETVVLGALPATVTVGWAFENGQLCTPNGVVEVEAILFDASSNAEPPVSADCGDGQLVLEDIEAGTWSLLLNGNDEQGRTQFSGTVDLILDRGDDQSVSLTLSAD